MKRILIVEDDNLIAELERDYLEAEGYAVDVCDNGILGLKKAMETDYSLLLLDVMLPGLDGFGICREIRKSRNIPIIMVTAKDTDEDKIRGLNLGSDDYITKPFSPSELVARVNAHINMHERLLSSVTPVNRDVIETRELKILIPQRQVFVGGREISLKNKEFELLLFLAENPNIVFSKDILLDRIWGIDAVGGTATVTVHINRIRDKIEKDSSQPEYIQTVWGAGYKFSAV